MKIGITASSDTPTDYILDYITSAGYAYSLRKLRSAYSGSAIRVVRHSDNATQDIGFDSSGNLDVASLTSFIGSSTGSIGTWYDQSGNARDVINNGTASTRPVIINSGTLQTCGPNNRPAIKFTSASNQRLSSSSMAMLGISLSTGGETFAIVVQQQNADDHAGCTVGHGNDSGSVRYGLFLGFSGDYIADLGNFTTRRVTVAEPASVGGQHSNIIVYDDGTSEQKIIRNGTTLVTGTNTADPTSVTRNLYIGSWGQPSLYFDGFIQEVIVWPSNQVSNLTSAQTSIDVYYQ